MDIGVDVFQYLQRAITLFEVRDPDDGSIGGHRCGLEGRRLFGMGFPALVPTYEQEPDASAEDKADDKSPGAPLGLLHGLLNRIC